MQNSLADERKHSRVEPLQLSHFLYGKQMHEDTLRAIATRFQQNFDFNIYGLGRIGMIEDSIRYWVEVS